MNTVYLKRLVYLTLIFGYIPQTAAWIDLSAFDKNFQEMEKSFKRMRKDMHEDVKAEFKNIHNSSWKVTYDDKTESAALKVIISGVDTHNIETQLHDDDARLSIVTDNGTIVVKVVKNWVSLSLEQRTERTQKTDKSSASHASYSSMSSSQTVERSLDLVEAKIDYKSAEKTLIVTIPYKKADQNNKKIPVKMH